MKYSAIHWKNSEKTCKEFDSVEDAVAYFYDMDGRHTVTIKPSLEENIVFQVFVIDRAGTFVCMGYIQKYPELTPWEEELLDADVALSECARCHHTTEIPEGSKICDSCSEEVERQASFDCDYDGLLVDLCPCCGNVMEDGDDILCLDCENASPSLGS